MDTTQINWYKWLLAYIGRFEILLYIHHVHVNIDIVFI